MELFSLYWRERGLNQKNEPIMVERSLPWKTSGHKNHPLCSTPCSHHKIAICEPEQFISGTNRKLDQETKKEKQLEFSLSHCKKNAFLP